MAVPALNSLMVSGALGVAGILAAWLALRRAWRRMLGSLE